MQWIKDESGSWIIGQQAILNSVELHFSRGYDSSNPQHILECTARVPKLVSEDLNRVLLSLVSNEEIKEAVFSMGALKAPGRDGFNGLFFSEKLGYYRRRGM